MTKKNKIISAVAAGAFVLLAGGNYYASSKAEEALSKEIGKIGVGYDSISCSSFPTFNPTCTIEDLGKDLGIMIEELRIGNLSSLDGIMSSGEGSMNIDLYVKGLKMEGEPRGMLGMYLSLASPADKKLIKDAFNLFSLDELGLEMSGKTIFKGHDIVKLEDFKVLMESEWLESETIQTAEFEKGLFAQSSRMKDDDFLKAIKKVDIDFEIKNREDFFQIIGMLEQGNLDMSRSEKKEAGRAYEKKITEPTLAELAKMKEALAKEVKDEDLNEVIQEGIESLEKIVSGDKKTLEFQFDADGKTFYQALEDIQKTEKMPDYLEVSLNN